LTLIVAILLFALNERSERIKSEGDAAEQVAEYKMGKKELARQLNDAMLLIKKERRQREKTQFLLIQQNKRLKAIPSWTNDQDNNGLAFRDSVPFRRIQAGRP
jgi:hypothetical protein